MNSTFEIIRVVKQEARPFQESVHWFTLDQLEQPQQKRKGWKRETEMEQLTSLQEKGHKNYLSRLQIAVIKGL